MPRQFASQAQARAFHAAASGKSTLGIPKGVAQKAVRENAGRKIGGLPTRVRHLKSKTKGRS
jgi:hypothetical protein